MNKDNLKINKVKEMNQLANEIGDVMEVIQLINDLINFMPNRQSPEVKVDPLFYYKLTREAIGNVHQVSQGIYKDLDNIAVKLYDMADELKKESEQERITVDGIVLEDGKIVKDKNEQVEK